MQMKIELTDEEREECKAVKIYNDQVNKLLKGGRWIKLRKRKKEGK